MFLSIPEPMLDSRCNLLKSSYSARNVFSLARIALRLSPFAFCSFMLAIRTFSFCLTVWFISLRTWDNFMYCWLFSSPASFMPLRTALRLPILTFKSWMFFAASLDRSFRSITTCLVDVTPLDAIYRVYLLSLFT